MAESNENVEIAMQTAEAFGRGLFAEHFEGKSGQWTIHEWLETVSEHVFNPMGMGVTITDISEDKATSLMFRCLLHESADDPHLASLFTYGYLRGVFLIAFPDGEVLMKSTMAHGAPMTELIFKTNAGDEDKQERERVKTTLFTISK